mgnify:FL=1
MRFRTYMFMSHLEGDLQVSVSRWTFNWTCTPLNQLNPTQILFGAPYSISTCFSNSISLSNTLFVFAIVFYLVTRSATCSFIIIIILFNIKLSIYYRLEPLIPIIMYFSIFPCIHVIGKKISSASNHVWHLVPLVMQSKQCLQNKQFNITALWTSAPSTKDVNNWN